MNKEAFLFLVRHCETHNKLTYAFTVSFLLHVKYTLSSLCRLSDTDAVLYASQDVLFRRAYST